MCLVGQMEGSVGGVGFASFSFFSDLTLARTRGCMERGCNSWIQHDGTQSSPDSNSGR